MLPAAERAALIEKHRDYAISLAVDLLHMLPRSVSRDEVLAAAREGLVTAASRFDPTRGVQFTTYAYYRIRGAVFDYVRRESADDPRLRARAVALAATDDAAESTAASVPREADTSPADIAAQIGQVLETAATAFVLAEFAEQLSPPETRTRTPEMEASRRELGRAMQDAVNALPEKEKKLVTAMYLEGVTLEEAGKRMKLSKSWASRLHARALSLLRPKLESFSK